MAVEGVLHAKADRNWTLPPLDLLGLGDAGHAGTSSEIRRSAEVIEQTLAHFNIAAKVVEVTPGPVVTRYELKIAPGILLSRVESLNDNLALALAARTLRIEAPIPARASSASRSRTSRWVWCRCATSSRRRSSGARPPS